MRDLRRLLKGEEYYVLVAQGRNDALYVRLVTQAPESFILWLNSGDTAPGWAKMNSPFKLLRASEALTRVEAEALEEDIKSWDRQTKLEWAAGRQNVE